MSADGEVTITMSMQDAAAMLGWRRQRKGSDDLTAGIRTAQTAFAGMTRAQAESWQRFSALGKQALESQSKWSQGLAELGRQNDQVKKSAEWDATFARNETAASRFGGVADRALGGMKRGLDSAATSLDSVAGRWARIGTAVALAAGTVRRFQREIQEVREREAEATFDLDEQMRGFAAQAGMGDVERKQATSALLDIADRQATPTRKVVEIAKQLVSSGYTPEQVTQKGGVTEAMTATMQAAAEKGEFVSPKELAAAATRFLLAQGGAERGEQKQLPEETRRSLLATDKFVTLMQDVHGLYTKANLQFEHLTAFAEAAPVMARAGIDPRTQLALATQSVDVLEPDTAATSLRNVISRMRNAGAHKEKIAALASIGLKPEDIDMEGESVDEAFARFRDALSGSAKVTQDMVLTKIFEEKGAQGASVWVTQASQLDMFRRIAADHSGFDAAHRQTTSGPAAAKTRGEIEAQRQLYGGEGFRDKLIEQSIENLPEGRYGRAGQRVAALFYRTVRNIPGVDPGLALALSTTGHEEAMQVVENARQRMQSGGPGFAPSAEAGAEPSGEAGDPVRSQERAAMYAERAAAFRKSAEAEEQNKRAKKLSADVNRASREFNSVSNRRQTAASQTAAADRKVAEAEKAIQVHNDLEGAARRRPTQQQQIRQAAALDRLNRNLEEAQRRQEAAREHEKELLEKQNGLLADILSRIGGGTVPGIPARAPQRTPPVIGGN